MTRLHRPFGPGSVSLGLHPNHALPVRDQIGALCLLARTAEEAGFDGVTVSEHHAGFPAYLPQPLIVCNWLLGETERIWSAPAPVLLGLRNPLLLAEELAWTAARFPGRVGAVFAPGYAASDFAALGIDFDGRLSRADEGVRRLLGVLRGANPPGDHANPGYDADFAMGADSALGTDQAVARWRDEFSEDPADGLLLAANSGAAIRRAAALGLGVLYPGNESGDRLGGLTRAFRAAGGRGPVVWITRAWIDDGRALEHAGAADAVAAAYANAAAPGMRQEKGFASVPALGSAGSVLEQLTAGIKASGSTGVNLRLSSGAEDVGRLREQIRRIGTILPSLRSALDGDRDAD